MFEQLLKEYGPGIILVAAVAWLLKSIINHALSKNVDQHRELLKVEALRSSELLKRRGETIEELYYNLVKLVRATGSFVNVWGRSDDPSIKEKRDCANEAYHKLQEHYRRYRIFFSEGLCDKIDSFVKKMTDPASDLSFNLFMDEESGEKISSETRESWSKAYEDFNKFVPDAFKSIEKEFRSLLGIKCEILMAVNWKKGFRRIALIWATLAAIVGAFVGFKIAAEEVAKELEHAQSMLQTFEKGNGVSEWYLLDGWKERTSVEAQEWLWKFWTGEDLEESFKRSAVSEEKFRKKYPSWTPTEKSLFDTARLVEQSKALEISPAYTWTMSQESRERLKEQGWQTVNGEVLPYTPDMVSRIDHNRSLKEARYEVLTIQFIYRPLGIVVGGVVGFCVAWLVYLILERLVLFGAWLILWVNRGFHDAVTEQKSED
jgi:hypothetical protein